MSLLRLPIDAFLYFFNVFGTVSRGRYWATLLVLITTCVVLYATDDLWVKVPYSVEFIRVISSLILLVTYIPFTAKRLKDTGISGWWVFLLFVPFGQLIVSVLALMPTDQFKKTTEPV